MVGNLVSPRSSNDSLQQFFGYDSDQAEDEEQSFEHINEIENLINEIEQTTPNEESKNNDNQSLDYQKKMDHLQVESAELKHIKRKAQMNRINSTMALNEKQGLQMPNESDQLETKSNHKDNNFVRQTNTKIKVQLVDKK